jgi:ribonuclease R
MVAANEAVAEWLVARGLPGLFRVHDSPAPDRVQRLAELAKRFGLEPGFGPTLTPRGLAAFETQFRAARFAAALRTVLGKTLGPARYTMFPAPHFGLGAPLYLHFTSPIRRYADLAVHRIVKRHLEGNRSQIAFEPELESLGQRLNQASYVAQKAEAERHRMLVARLLASRIGEEVRGNVVAVMGGQTIDLMDADITTSPAVLDVFALWGGIEILVPDHWEVISEVTPFMAGFEMKRGRAAGDPSKRLIIRGAAVMAGIEVKARRNA